MEQVDIVIIGAGVVGLALAERLSRRFSGPDREIVLVERHDGFGRETSSRNSEVIHAGLYYGEDLLKTRLCVRGRSLLYELCEKVQIPYRKTGKLVLATTEDEIEQLEALEVQAKNNGVSGVLSLGPREFELLEPYVFGLMGLYCPESGIVDSHQLMSYFEHKSESRGVTIAYNCSVMGLQKNGTSFTVRIDDADGENLYLETSLVINAAGLGADTIAEMAGIDIDAAGYRIYPCKGEYFAVSGRHTDKLNHLVYPLPTPTYLGAHASLDLNGHLKIGPNAFYVEELNYDVDPAHQEACHRAAHKFLPFIEYEDLSPDMSGIRPKLYRKGEPFRDFVIREESDRGLAGLINLIGIESPGLTACLSIAEMVDTLVEL